MEAASPSPPPRYDISAESAARRSWRNLGAQGQDFGHHEWGDRGRKRAVAVGCLIAGAIGAVIWFAVLAVVLYFTLRA